MGALGPSSSFTATALISIAFACPSGVYARVFIPVAGLTLLQSRIFVISVVAVHFYALVFIALAGLGQIKAWLFVASVGTFRALALISIVVVGVPLRVA